MLNIFNIKNHTNFLYKIFFKYDNKHLSLDGGGEEVYMNYEIIKNNISKSVFGFSFDALFSMNKQKNKFQYEDQVKLFLRYITKKISAETLQIEFNAFAQETEDLIHYIYHGGSTYDTLFWQIAKEVSKNKLKTSKKFKEIYSIFFRNKNTYVTNCNWRLGDYSILVYDKNFEYNYFSNNFIIR